jgi:pimeloyl-ACP methyl ester carboxylesterase
MTTTETTNRGGAYVDAAGLRTYYERTGSGHPLVLLHGGFCTAETFDGLTPQLAPAYTVYVPERRGHGRTGDVDGPITYKIMAADTMAFLEALGLTKAHLVGYSDGAVVALLVALQRPDLVDRLVLIGQPINAAGMPEFVRAMIPNFSQQMLPPFLKALYAATSPDGPQHFDVVFDKLRNELTREPNMQIEEVAGLAAPTLVLLGDRDMITPEHAVALVRTIPVAQLGIVPGAEHSLPMDKPDLVARLVTDFLAVDFATAV